MQRVKVLQKELSSLKVKNGGTRAAQQILNTGDSDMHNGQRDKVQAGMPLQRKARVLSLNAVYSAAFDSSSMFASNTDTSTWQGVGYWDKEHHDDDWVPVADMYGKLEKRKAAWTEEVAVNKDDKHFDDFVDEDAVEAQVVKAGVSA